MGCKGCTVCTTSDGSPEGCGSKGNCATGGCNRLNTFDWLSDLEIFDTDPYDIVEISFKNGARKDFYRVPEHLRTASGDWVVVETGNGYDIGKISLSGDLVRLQMKKKRTSEKDVAHNVIRRANERDLERLDEARALEPQVMVRARAIARTLGLDMKVGDVEYQGDKRKATFYYTADGRVDFRELIRHYAKEFRIKIEMRQIGARQESARIGGLGSCGRELCCSTWLSDFKSVSTAAARYQNLAINQAKLSGQCGRLKCCLNYELDTYLEALEAFPERAEKLRTKGGTAVLIKTDVFKKMMYYVIEGERGKVYPMPVDKVVEIQADIKAGKAVDFTKIRAEMVFQDEEEDLLDFGGDVTGAIELPEEQKRRKKKRGNRRKGRRNKKGGGKNRSKSTNRSNSNKSKSEGDNKNSSSKGGKSKNRNRRRKPRNQGGNQKSNNNNNNNDKK
ncbi:MAG TPA: regulatory iron-sulfur-containing complex subunit RicT [Saprospiraceae bacterium]|nr:regulatory iron-sulfur-containing complex subunit RicT [Saprospiraceae bacterium]